MDYNYTYTYHGSAPNPVMTIVWLALMIAAFAGSWKIFEKAGRPGWAALIPLYNVWTLFDIVYGKGSRMFLLFIPLFNIYVVIKYYIDLAHAFEKPSAFAAGLVFLGPVFTCILGFDDSVYQGVVGAGQEVN